MITTLPDFSSAQVLVAGDLMLDRYWGGATSRISPEAPVPVVRVDDRHDRPGGAANVALNIRHLGAQCQLAGILGDDEAATSLEALLRDHHIECDFTRDKTLQTTLKLRIISRQQQLIRLDFEDSPDQIDTTTFNQRVIAALAQNNALLLSDYNKGALADIEPLIAAANASGKPVLIDPKGNSFERYRNATLLTPNKGELEQVVGHCSNEAQLLERAENLRQELNLQALLVTRGDEGMSLIQAGCAPFTLPAHAKEVYDVTGAGDTVIGTFASALAAGSSFETATKLANYAASVAVSKLGTATVSPPELQQSMLNHQPLTTGVTTSEALKPILDKARAAGERIIMTNGCFDILHAGHVSYLAEARQEGDRLIVAVNSDDSVTRLKGQQRPINPLPQRMAVLAALESVDWVVSFNGDTPEDLICDLLPDALIKGGDYQPNEIAGGQCVQNNGGQVIIKQFIDGQSTSKIIDRIQALD